MAYFLAIGSAVLYGGADFLGGLASRRTSAIAVVAVSQCAGLVLLALLLPVLPDAAPSASDVMWGGVAGLTGGVGVALLYRALAVGSMAVVAPTTAVCAVMIPVITEALLGERLAGLTIAGIALAIVAIVLVSQQDGTSPDTGRPAPNEVEGPAPSGVEGPGAARRRLPRGIGLAFASGIAIGLFFLSLARTTPEAGLWPLLAARAVSVMLFVTIALGSARSLRMAAPVARLTVAGGALDVLANALYVLATRDGPLSVVVTLASLYPASTVVLARVVLRERLNVWQTSGMVCALIAVVVIVGSG